MVRRYGGNPTHGTGSYSEFNQGHADQPPAATTKEKNMNTNIPQAVSEYMASIGSKGGKANPAGTAKRRKQARDAARSRWAKWRLAIPEKGKAKK